MKIALVAILSVFTSIQALAFASNARDNGQEQVVVGFDKSVFAGDSPIQFPCLERNGDAACGASQVVIQDSVCAHTVLVENKGYYLEISCRLKFKDVVLGHAPANVKPIPSVQSPISFLPVKFTKSVQVKKTFKRTAVGVNYVTELIVTP